MAITEWRLKKEIFRAAVGVRRDDGVIEKVSEEWEAEDKRNKFELLLQQYSHRWHLPGHDVNPKSRYASFFEKLARYLECAPGGGLPGDVLIFGTAADVIRSLPEKFRAKVRAAVSSTRSSVPSDLFPALKAAVESVDSGSNGESGRRQSHAGSAADTNPAGPSGIGLPAKGRRLALRDTRASGARPYVSMWTTLSAGTMRLLEDGLEARHIDQSLYYQTAESVNLWFSITNNEYYTGFDQCETGLKNLVRNNRWKSYIAADKFDGVVMLGGGGSPSKDKVILKSMVDSLRAAGDGAKRPRFTLLDASHYMLESSKWDLHESLDALRADDLIDVSAVKCDMLNLAPAHRLVRPGAGSIAWFLTGGTLGNLDENDFFAAVASEAQVDDWLVIGCGCTADNVTEEYLQQLVNEYEQEVVKNFVKVPLGAVWSSLDMSGRVADALGSIKARPVRGEANPFSAVPKTVTVIATIDIEALGEVVLFKSSRYDEVALIEYAKTHRWEHVTSFTGLDEHFKQIVFRYSPE